jgi:hypothetical protein
MTSSYQKMLGTGAPCRHRSGVDMDETVLRARLNACLQTHAEMP